MCGLFANAISFHTTDLTFLGLGIHGGPVPRMWEDGCGCHLWRAAVCLPVVNRALLESLALSGSLKTLSETQSSLFGF